MIALTIIGLMFLSEINAEQEPISEIATPKIYANRSENHSTFGQANLSFIEIVSRQVSESSKKAAEEDILAVKIQSEPFGEDKELYGQPITPEFDEKQPFLEEIIAEVEKYGWNAEIMLKIAKCESGFNPYAINYADAEITGFPSMGVFQLNRPYDVKYFDYKINIRIAYEEFYLPRGYAPWSCSYILGIL